MASSKTLVTEGLLNRVENDPTPKNIDKVQDELTTQMEEDEGYAAQLQNLVNQLKAAVWCTKSWPVAWKWKKPWRLGP